MGLAHVYILFSTVTHSSIMNIWEKPASMYSYKYLEIPILII